jgi:hypothetical protein
VLGALGLANKFGIQRLQQDCAKVLSFMLSAGRHPEQAAVMGLDAEAPCPFTILEQAEATLQQEGGLEGLTQACTDNIKHQLCLVSMPSPWVLCTYITPDVHIKSAQSQPVSIGRLAAPVGTTRCLAWITVKVAYTAHTRSPTLLM